MNHKCMIHLFFIDYIIENIYLSSLLKHICLCSRFVHYSQPYMQHIIHTFLWSVSKKHRSGYAAGTVPYQFLIQLSVREDHTLSSLIRQSFSQKATP